MASHRNHTKCLVYFASYTSLRFWVPYRYSIVFVRKLYSSSLSQATLVVLVMCVILCCCWYGTLIYSALSIKKCGKVLYKNNIFLLQRMPHQVIVYWHWFNLSWCRTQVRQLPEYPRFYFFFFSISNTKTTKNSLAKLIWDYYKWVSISKRERGGGGK